MLLSLTAIASCGGDTRSSATCIPGQQVECACPGGGKGAQACRADGSGFNDCACGGGASGAGGAAGMGGTGGAAGGPGGGGAAGVGGGEFDAAMPDKDATTPTDVSEAGPLPDGDNQDAELDTSTDISIADSGVDSLNTDATCMAPRIVAERKQVDLYMMIDSSGSMETLDPGQTLSRWGNLTQAMPTFLNDPVNAGMQIGLDFFPEGANNPLCTPNDYAMADVAVDFIPGMNNAQVTALVNAINGRMRTGGTPTTPALNGALQAAKAWQMAHPERSISVLLLTDGEPLGCTGNTVNAAAAVAQQYANGTPPIKTFVLGVGPATGPLDAIAAGGGTRMAYMVTNGGAAALAQALADIRKSTLSCEYSMPKVDSGMVDPTKINVSTRVGPTG
ncbi:MAG: vWA domain-containing protein, partial [Polyangiaceae bacterium]